MLDRLAPYPVRPMPAVTRLSQRIDRSQHLGSSHTTAIPPAGAASTSALSSHGLQTFRLSAPQPGSLAGRSCTSHDRHPGWLWVPFARKGDTRWAVRAESLDPTRRRQMFPFELPPIRSSDGFVSRSGGAAGTELLVSQFCLEALGSESRSLHERLVAFSIGAVAVAASKEERGLMTSEERAKQRSWTTTLPNRVSARNQVDARTNPRRVTRPELWRPWCTAVWSGTAPVGREGRTGQ